jgi:Domain of unknown function (DUF6983)
MSVEVPFFSTASFSEEVTLDDTPYRLEFHWNYRGQYWTMDIHDRDGNALVEGVKVVVSYGLSRRFRWTGSPPGELTVVKPPAPYERIGRLDMGDVARLLYTTGAELAAL